MPKRNVRFNRQPQLVVQQMVFPPGPRILPSLFPVRVLVGWLHEPNDIPYLAGAHRTNISHADYLRYRQLIRAGNRARAALPILSQTGIVGDLESEFEYHAVQWRGLPQAQSYINEGWEIKSVHLPKVISAQPLVEKKKCDSLMASIHPDDRTGLADLALPLNRPSFLQVARVGDRFVLRDGYHRAHALMRSGVTQVPGLYREVRDLVELTLPIGTFSPQIIFSARPPVLADFLDPVLAATIH